MTSFAGKRTEGKEKKQVKKEDGKMGKTLCEKGICELEQDVHRIMDEAVRSGEVAGINALILQHGEEKLFASSGMADMAERKPVQRRTIFRLYSQTKPVTSAAVMKLVEEGRLDIMDEAQRYLPGFRNQKVLTAQGEEKVQRPVRILDLLSMTSGRPSPDADPAGQAMGELFFDNEARMDRGEGMDTQAFANAMGQCPLAFQPGTQFRYGVSADVLGAVVECVSGMPFPDYLKKTFFEPLDMEDTDFCVPADRQDRLCTCYERTEKGLEVYPVRHLCVRDHVSQPAFASGGAGLMSTLDDYAAFAAMLMNRGSYQGKRILREKTVDFMTSHQVDDTGWETLTGYGYGHLMRVCREAGKASLIAEQGEYGWDGWLGTYFANLPASGLTVLIFQNTRDTGTGRVTRCVRNLVVSALGGGMV